MKTSSSLCVILTAAGLYSAVAFDPVAPTGRTANPAKAGDGVQVGVATLDGVTISGGEAFVTRSGATEKLTKELRLPSGVTVRPNGSVILADQTKATLQASQLLTLEGEIVDLPPNPSENPGDPRGNGTSTRPLPPETPSGVLPTATVAGIAGSGRSLQRNGGAGVSTVFLTRDGVPFMGVINPNGTVTRADGTVMRIDGSFRAVTFGTGGTPALGTVNSNGTITRTDGATIALDGSLRAADGTILSPSPNANAGASTNANTATNGDNTATTNTQQGVGGTQQGGPTQQGVGGTQQIDPATGQPFTNSGSPRNTNSPNNTGTVSNDNTNQGAPGISNGNTQGGGTPASGASGAGRSSGGAKSGAARGSSGSGNAGAAVGGAGGAKK